MARQPPQPNRPFHNIVQKRQDIVRLQRRIAELETFDPNVVTSRLNDSSTVAIETSIQDTLSSIYGHGSTEYNRYCAAASLDNGPYAVSMDWGGGRSDRSHQDRLDAVKYVTEGRQRSITLLQSAIKGLQEEIELESPATPPETIATPTLLKQKIFVVHGHDEGAKQALARFLEKLKLETILLSEQPDKGMTVIEKFETHANQVGFAVVLLTPDDIAMGSPELNVLALRARQNVVFELGFFVGKLGRGSTCLLKKGQIEIPSDLYGVIYTELDATDGWKLKLGRELKAAGIQFDSDKLLN